MRAFWLSFIANCCSSCLSWLLSLLKSTLASPPPSASIVAGGKVVRLVLGGERLGRDRYGAVKSTLCSSVDFLDVLELGSEVCGGSADRLVSRTSSFLLRRLLLSKVRHRQKGIILL
jgi:hypothetical protein